MTDTSAQSGQSQSPGQSQQPQSPQPAKSRFTVATHQQPLSTPTSEPIHEERPIASSPRVKEREPVAPPQEIDQIEEMDTIEVAPEVKEAGLVVKSETVEIPPIVENLGVTHAGYSSPITAQKPAGPTLPLSDDKIVAARQRSVFESIRWLAEWCIKQLKRGKWRIQNDKGHITRVRN